MRKELNEESVTKMKKATDKFVKYWGVKWIENPEFMLQGGASSRFEAVQD